MYKENMPEGIVNYMVSRSGKKVWQSRKTTIAYLTK